MSHYTLPNLRYDYGALEPHIMGRIMQLHHDKHHAGAAEGGDDGTNDLLVSDLI
jgi:Fe-Mn family superoxide dismutase